MEFIRITAKTVDEAITKALIELETTSDKVEYEVIEKGSTGILGIFGAKPAIIQARKKQPEPVVEVKPSEPVVTAPIEQEEFTVEQKAVNFFNKVFDAMNVEVAITTKYNESLRELSIELAGKDMGTLIGKRGQTLDSLQYLVSIVVNKKAPDYIRVKLDTENYRERRKETLETLAKNLAYKVKRTKRPVALEPMNPYERRIIHSALQNDKYVVTRSEGEEPFRHVVIALKRDRY